MPFRAPRSVLNGRIMAPRRFATQAYDMDRLKAVATAAGASLNDVFLAICGAASLPARAERAPRTHAHRHVPVSVRPEGGASVGNAITFLYTGLSTDAEDPAGSSIRNPHLKGSSEIRWGELAARDYL